MNPSVIDKSKFSDVKNQNRLEKFTGTQQYRIHMTPFHNLIRFSSCQVPEVSYFVTNILVFDVSISSKSACRAPLSEITAILECYQWP